MDLQRTVTAKHFGTEPTFMLEERFLWAGLCFKQRQVGKFAFPLLDESCQGVKRVGCGCNAGQGVGEDDATGRARR